MATVARSYITARDAFVLDQLTLDLEKLTSQIGAERQITLLGEISQALAKGTQWFLSNLAAPINIQAGVSRFQSGILKLLDSLEDILPPGEFESKNIRLNDYVQQGISEQVAERFSTLPYLYPACEVVIVAEETSIDVVVAGKVYFALASALQLDKLVELLQRMAPRSHWDRLASAGMYDDIVKEHRRLAIQVLLSDQVKIDSDFNITQIQKSVDHWLTSGVFGYDRWKSYLSEIENESNLDLSMLSVVIRTLGRLGDVALSQNRMSIQK